jgi:hypothetical protein
MYLLIREEDHILDIEKYLTYDAAYEAMKESFVYYAETTMEDLENAIVYRDGQSGIDDMYYYQIIEYSAWVTNDEDFFMQWTIINLDNLPLK